MNGPCQGTLVYCVASFDGMRPKHQTHHIVDPKTGAVHIYAFDPCLGNLLYMHQLTPQRRGSPEPRPPSAAYSCRRLVMFRRAKKWSGFYLSQVAGIPYARYVQIEDGEERHPSPAEINKLATALGCNVADLMEGT